MSDNLYLYVLRDVEDENAHAHWISESARLMALGPYTTEQDDERFEALKERVRGIPNCWIGEVSWIMVEMMAPHERPFFVPPVVDKVSDIVPAKVLTTLTDDVIAKLRNALLEYHPRHSYKSVDMAARAVVRTFVERHAGKHATTITW